MQQPRARSELQKFQGETKGIAKFTVGVLLLVMVGIPIAFAVFDEDTLRMSDEFSSITASAIGAMLLIKAVETYTAMRQTRESFYVLRSKAEDPNGGPVTPTDRERARSYAAIAFVSIVSLSVLAVALMLVILWSAIDGHGPAKWLAWFSWCSIGFGLGVLIWTSLLRYLLESGEVAQLHAFLPPDPSAPVLGASSGTGDEAASSGFGAGA
ncbi:hypothetical protein ACFV0W_12200 [Streptomyces anulatus]